jgi:hypothetical protein
MKLIRILAALVALALSGQVPAFATDAGDSPAAIRAVIHEMFDRPDAELVIDPVVVVDGFAVAGWTQGQMGGRAFLKEHHGHWMLVLCTGDQITSAEALAASGVPPESATKLAAEIAAADANVDAARLAMFASFEGVVTMDEHPKH